MRPRGRNLDTQLVGDGLNAFARSFHEPARFGTCQPELLLQLLLVRRAAASGSVMKMIAAC